MSTLDIEEDYPKFRKAVIKRLKFLEGLIGDAFEKISEVESHTAELTDEAIDHAQRAQRAVRRLQKELEEEE